MKSVSIFGASGLAGGELLRLLGGCGLEVSKLFGSSGAGKKACEIHKHLDCGKKIEAWDGEPEADLLFFAAPAGVCADALAKNPGLPKECRIVDLSGDFRLKNAADYPKWYGFGHPCPQLLKEAVYGLPELNRAAVKKANLVANPGCYATSVILGLAPFAKNAKHIVVDSCSGVSGAGNAPSTFNSFCNAAEDVIAYDAAKHKHVAEMQQELGCQLSFTPHLVPITRGILSTIHVFFENPVAQGVLEKNLKWFYKGEKFVKIIAKPANAGKGWMPSVKMARGTNNCLIAAEADGEHSGAVVVSAIDNIVKGAAGQAIQNANLMLGLKEDAGLPTSPLYP